MAGRRGGGQESFYQRVMRPPDLLKDDKSEGVDGLGGGGGVAVHVPGSACVWR